MFDNPIVLLSISTIFASIPVAIWIYILLLKEEKSKKILSLVFGLGCLTAPALLGLQYVWDFFPRFDLAAFIETSIMRQSTMFILMFMLFGAMEEIIKLFVVRSVDKKTLLIKTIGDSIRYAIAAALGFSFTENIYYLYEFWPSISTGELVGMYIFRSIFTTCAHMIFSGIFGYYYGIGKFSSYIREQAKQTGKSERIVKLISKIFKIPLSHAYQQKMIFTGLFLAIGIHATYNLVLQYNMILPVILFVVMGYLYLRFLLSRKTGHLQLATDISEKKKASIAKEDEDVVMELLGAWFQDKRYRDVIQICERLLEKDPDNEIVKLFKAKSLDKLEVKRAYQKIISNVKGKGNENIAVKDKSKLSKFIEAKQKEKKEQKNVKTPTPPPQEQEKAPTPQKTPKKKGNVLDEYTDGDSFKLD